MYTIKVNYRTGSSFSTEECEDTIGLCWNNVELARKALLALKEHYELYSDLDRYGHNQKTDQDIYNIVKTKYWYKKADKTNNKWYTPVRDWYNYCAVEMDDGSFRRIPTNMWCGYFETLYTAELVNENDKVTFNRW